MKFPVNYFGSITNWVKASYTHWGENWFLQVGDNTQGWDNRFYLAQDAPLNTNLFKCKLTTSEYKYFTVRWNGTAFISVEEGQFGINNKDGIGRYCYTSGAWVVTEVYVKGAVLRRPDYYAQKGGFYVKSIALGDSLGLVYWDGTLFNVTERGFVLTGDFFIGARSNPSGGLEPGLVTLGNDAPHKTWLNKAGTTNFEAITKNRVVREIQGGDNDKLVNHLFHVI